MNSHTIVASIIFLLLLITSFNLSSALGQTPNGNGTTIVLTKGLDDIAKTLQPSTRLGRQVIGQNDLQTYAAWKQYTDKLSQYQKGVARIQVPLMGEVGTGFLISDSLLLTNKHVLPSVGVLTGATADFSLGHTETEQPDRFNLNTTIFYSNRALDYSVVKVDTKRIGDEMYEPGRLFSFLPLSDYAQAGQGNRTTVIGYPDGGNKTVASGDGTVQYNKPGGFVVYTSDTEHGSSGSPVFNRNAQLIALHHFEGDKYPNGTAINNEGIMIGEIIQDLKSKLPISEAGKKLLAEMNLG